MKHHNHLSNDMRQFLRKLRDQTVTLHEVTERAFVPRAVQLLLGGVREGGPQAGGLRVAESDQHPGEQGGGAGQLGGGAAGIGVRGAQDFGQNGPGAREIPCRR
jgi:hypothetical protein